eukprot:CAMPEP_0168328510 /NCGR_PEP_ID=MMETSP0213-20121227/6548_1 /TAXON_ID=151035 /ORGANISM="Euplotes harpa, Strain FSP1.4" /LENGTH=55 /DNA_ID=CAMNT_0008331643 /DNA_START=950 /DNA_END=1117 /DNA_ORIENTATION=+
MDGLKKGRGDLSPFLVCLQSADCVKPLVKLELINSRTYKGRPLLADKNVEECIKL